MYRSLRSGTHGAPCKWFPFVPGGTVQGSRSEELLERRLAGEHDQRTRWRRRQHDHTAATATARHAPQQGHQQAVRDHTQRHRQVLANRVSGVFRLLQPHVLDHLPAHQRRGRRWPGAARGGLVEKQDTVPPDWRLNRIKNMLKFLSRFSESSTNNIYIIKRKRLRTMRTNPEYTVLWYYYTVCMMTIYYYRLKYGIHTHTYTQIKRGFRRNTVCFVFC